MASPILTLGTKSLRRRPLRTLLLLTAFGVSSAFLVLVQGYLETLQRQIERATVVLAGGHVSLYGISKPSFGRTYALLPEVAPLETAVRAQLPPGSQVSRRVVGLSRLIAMSRAVPILATGVRIDDEPALLELLSAGGLVVAGDPVAALRQPGKIVLFESQLEKLDVKLGEPVTLLAEMASGRFTTVDLVVGAVLRDIGGVTAFSTFTHLESAAQLFGHGQDQASKLLVYLPDEAATEATFGRLRRLGEDGGHTLLGARSASLFQVLMREGREKWKGVRLHVTTWRDEAPELVWRIPAARGLKVLVYVLLCTLVAMGLANTMWVAIRERHREIGAMRAIGMHRRSVLLAFVLEAALLSSLGAIAGAALGLAASAAFNGMQVVVEAPGYRALMLDSAVRFSVLTGHVAAVVFGFGVIGVVASIWPAYSAAKVAPVTAMSDRV